MSKEHPILCCDSVVRAIRDGRQTQDRRPIKGLGVFVETQIDMAAPTLSDGVWIWPDGTTVKPPWSKGDILWVRETIGCFDGPEPDTYEGRYAADGEKAFDGWTYSRAVMPSIHMPRWACRTLLEVLDVRAERVQSISRADAKAEGISEYGHEFRGESWWPGDDAWRNAKSTENFRLLWDSLYAAKGYGWDANPWVWATTFRIKETT